MSDDREGFRFDLPTQQFLTGRWNTLLGETVLKEIVTGIQANVEIRAILDGYVLDHPKNVDSYAYPHYPREAMKAGDFWVLNSDDLRGATFYNENFEGSTSLEKKLLNYATFYRCVLRHASLERTDLSYARLNQCDLTHGFLGAASGFDTLFLTCNLQRACFWLSEFIDADFLGSDLRGAYFEDARIDNPRVSYATQFDRHLATQWRNRTLPASQRSDIFRMIRRAYAQQEIWTASDDFLLAERTARRRYTLWPALIKDRTPAAFGAWCSDATAAWATGYGTRLGRVVQLAAAVVMFFAAAYLVAGVPAPTQAISGDVFQSFYFSITSFTTLGYGDVTYSAERPWMRLLSTAEAVIGAIVLATTVTVLARKWFR